MEFQGEMAGARMELFSMAIQAAIHGLGVALVPGIFVQEELRRGVLVAPFGHATPSGFGYYLVQPEGQAGHPALTLFRQWIVSEARLHPDATVPN